MDAPTEAELDLSAIVIILGREEPFLYVAPTSDYAVHHVDRYLSGPSPDGTGGPADDGYPGGDAGEEQMDQVRRLTADELEYFTAAGQPLTVVDRDGQCGWGLEPAAGPGDPKAVQLTIRERILAIFNEANKRAVEQGWLEQVELPAPDCDYPTFIRQVMFDRKVGFDPRPNCNWFARVMGWCS